MAIKEDIDNWRKNAGLSTLKLGEESEIEYSMNIHGKDLSDITIVQLDEVMSTLANYLLYLSHEMGMIFARVKYLEGGSEYSSLAKERAKLNIIKPVTEAIKVKIDVLKKIYDRRVKEAQYAASNRG